MLTPETFRGPWAGLPVAWTESDEFDEQAYRADVSKCCRANVPGVYTGGTTGEFYAMEFDEFCRVASATIEECQENNAPAMIGCSSTYTLGVVRRAAVAAELGAAAIQVALPFWMEIGEGQIVSFFAEVARAADGLPISIYETTRAKRVLTLQQHRAIKDAVPHYLMVKANAGTIGCTAEGCAALSRMVNVFVGEGKWFSLCSHGAAGSCSSMVYWNPRVTLKLWNAIQTRDQEAVAKLQPRVEGLFAELETTYGRKGFTDTAFDRLGGLATGFLTTSRRSRGPYISVTSADVAALHAYLEEHFPQMLDF